MNHPHVRAAAVIAAALAATPAAAQGVYVFGDSAAEQGNLYALPGLGRPGAPYYAPDGFSRESNGPVWAEVLAPGLRPVLGAKIGDTRVNYAFSGATSGVGNIATDVETGLTRQVDLYAQRLASGAPRPAAGDLFVIEAGTNDFLRDLGVRDLRETSRETVANVTGAASRLVTLGARRILVEEVPDYIHAPAFNDLVPTAQRPALEKALADLGAQHRADQVAALARLNNQAGDGVDVVNVPINALFRHALANGQALGFKVVDKTCYDEETGVLCSADPAVQNSYLFFDSLHLSARGQALQADYYRALLAQLDGRANLVPGAVIRDGLAEAGEITAAERAERMRVWLDPDAVTPGFRAIAEVGDAWSRWKDQADSLAARAERRSLRVGLGYADGGGWTVRAVATRFEDETRHALGRHDLDGWGATVSGERRLGIFRLGASSTWLWGDADGERRLPVGLMSTRYKPEIKGQAADLQLGAVLASGDLSVTPSTWLRYSRAKLDGYAETGDTGLEMAYGDKRAETLHAGAGMTVAYRWQGVQPRVTVAYERLVAGHGQSITGELVGNSADPIRATFDTGRRDSLTIEPGLSVDLAPGIRLDFGARYRFGERDTAALGRVSVRF